MEAVSWSEVQYKQGPLPKLTITEEISRRDSITSSKSGDSGYNSDPDISLSPLDFVRPDKRFLCSELTAVPPTLPSVTLDPSSIDLDEVAPVLAKRLPKSNHASILLKRQKVLAIERPEVTSNPSAIQCSSNASKPHWSNAFKKSIYVSNIELLNNTTSQDCTKQIGKDEVEPWIDESIPSHNRPKERVSSIVSISSTGSGGDYSMTDDSEYEDAADRGGSTLSKAALKTIELIMRKIELNLRYAAYMQCAGGQPSRGQSTGEPIRGRRSSTQGSSSKRKSRGDDGLPPDDQDDNGPNKRRRVSITTTEDSDGGPRFACPFYKHDPNRYRNRRTCPGPGWPTVHRMKEHLYRSHVQPIFCPRCYTMFDADSDLSNHLRSDPCQMSAPQPIEGIDRETQNSLRRRSPPLRLEEDKWRDTYLLLFPDVPEEDIPSAYYDSDSPTEESRRFRRELLHRIRQELFATAEQEPGPAEQNLLRQVAGIIQRCEHELLNSFQPASGSLLALPRNYPHNNTPAVPSSSDSSAPASFRSATHPSAPASAPATTSSFPQTETEPAHQIHTHPLPGSGEPSLGESQYFTEQPLQGPARSWEDYLHLSSSDWIDWSGVFPPSDFQPLEHGESLPTFSTPVYT